MFILCREGIFTSLRVNDEIVFIFPPIFRKKIIVQLTLFRIINILSVYTCLGKAIF